jgi:hypothetical protein
VAWCIEGAGFQGAMARAVLTGMRFLTSAPYTRNIATDLQDCFDWLLPQLEGGERRIGEASEAVAYVTARREAMSLLQASKQAVGKAASRAE